MTPAGRRLSRFAAFGWFVLAFTIGVILWGAYVRATGSGAGCGSHWPLCNGVVIPRAEQAETAIEFTHRVTSGLSLLLVLVLWLWARRALPRGAQARKAASASAVFILLEALIGAGLVLFDLVGGNTSVARALSGALHLANTFFLLAALTLTAWLAQSGRAIALRGGERWLWIAGVAAIGVLFLGMTGAIAALGDTLFPSESLASGLQQDLHPESHFLIRLRVLHPILAAIVSVYLLLMARRILSNDLASTPAAPMAFAAVVLIQLLVGAINLGLLAPIPLQIVHLLLADLVWIGLVLLAADVLRLSRAGMNRDNPRSLA